MHAVPMRALLLALLLLLAVPLHAAELRLVTWNIAWLTTRPAGDPMLPESVRPRAPADIALLRGYAARLAADVVALQEVEGPEAAALVFDRAQWRFFFPDERDVQRAGFAVRRGIAARQNPDLAELDTAPRARFSQRRGTDITISHGGQELRLLSIHLNSGCWGGPMEPQRDRNCATLARQAEVLAGWIAAREAEGADWAILGDFNRRMEHPRDEMTAILGAAGRFGRPTRGQSNPCWADARGGRPFISHILLGGAARGWWRQGALEVVVYAERGRAYRQRLSDHCPIAVTLRLP